MSHRIESILIDTLQSLLLDDDGKNERFQVIIKLFQSWEKYIRLLNKDMSK